MLKFLDHLLWGCLGLVLILFPHHAYAQSAALYTPPVTAGNCASWYNSTNVLTDSGVGCANGQINVTKAGQGNLIISPTLIGATTSASLQNGQTNVPVYLTHDIQTGLDGQDWECKRVTNYTGGTFGYVNNCFMSYTINNAGTNSFEWSFLARLDNYGVYTDAAQDVAAYFQAHKYGTGSTWASTTELIDHAADPVAGSVTDEHDMSSTGTDAHGSRVMFDGWVHNAPGSSSTTATYGIRMNADTNTVLTHPFYINSGSYGDGFNTTAATFSTGDAIVLGDGQKICLDGATCGNYINDSAGTITIQPTNHVVTGIVNAAALNSSGQVTVPSGSNLCLDGTTCANTITQSAGTITITAGSHINSSILNAAAVNSGGQVTVPSSSKLCLDGTTCSNYLTQSGGVITIQPTSNITAGIINTAALNSSAQVTVPTNQKLCLNGTSCTSYLLYDGTYVKIYNASTLVASIDSAGHINGAANYQILGVNGVTCSGTPTASFVSQGGIVTHC